MVNFYLHLIKTLKSIHLSRSRPIQMEIPNLIFEIIRLILYSLYPIFMLYLNFVFLGIFILSPKAFNDVGVLIVFILFNVFQTFTIVYYILVYTSDSKSTQDIFPMALNQKIKRNYSTINPFIAESIKNTSIEKTHICEICQTYKPPRCHHCSRCNRCFLKMDHHCVFLDVCIGFHNYKFFILFMLSNIVFVSFYVIVVFIDIFGSGTFKNAETIVNFTVSSVFSLVVILTNIFFLKKHFMLISNNETTIESLAIDAYLRNDHSFTYIFQEGFIPQHKDSDDRKVLNPYNLGVKQNWKDVFGNTFWEWVSPSFTSSGDGITFKKNYTDDNDLRFKV